SARIRIISYGKERPTAVGSNEAAWRLNRRAESVLN
ncbi:MAG: peptidoglycan-associated lipoprotein, partial [Candidatus Puniceispirillaceae bacterium]